METSEDDRFFENRSDALFVVNVLADNAGYAGYIRSKGLSGVHILDIIDLFKNVFEGREDKEIIRTVNQLMREGLLISGGGGAVINPNPPVVVDLKGVDIKIEAISSEVEVVDAEGLKSDTET
ncbi:MAG: hypothetical protein EF813_05150 [Methanosarcinales archaeon]|nr:MAG: hypothetical protein EF813_05150 [Methanosarcinales archaeon]